MKGTVLALLILTLLAAVPSAFAAGPKATTEDWLYYLPVLGGIVAAVLRVNLAFKNPIIRKLRADGASKGA